MQSILYSWLIWYCTCQVLSVVANWAHVFILFTFCLFDFPNILLSTSLCHVIIFTNPILIGAYDPAFCTIHTHLLTAAWSVQKDSRLNHKRTIAANGLIVVPSLLPWGAVVRAPHNTTLQLSVDLQFFGDQYPQLRSLMWTVMNGLLFFAVL